MEKYSDITEYNDHYIYQHIKNKHFVVFGEISGGYFIDLTFSKNRKTLYTADSLQKMIEKIERSGIHRKPRRH